jgi:hypothetical protein
MCQFFSWHVKCQILKFVFSDGMIRFGGSYNLRESEGKTPRKLVATENCVVQNDPSMGGQFITCSVFFLDDTESNFQVAVSLTC